LRAVQAAAPPGLLRSLQKLQSLKNGSGALLVALTTARSSSCSTTDGSRADAAAGEVGGAGVQAEFAAACADLAAVLGEQQHAQLGERCNAEACSTYCLGDALHAVL
jgi:hypothetical protein